MVSYRPMYKLTTPILFALLLLLSQTALVSHDVQHLGNAHSEICAVYASQDHSASSAADCAEHNAQITSQDVQLAITDIVEPVTVSAYASRAPPKTRFTS